MRSIEVNETIETNLSLFLTGVAICSTRQFFTKLAEDSDEDDAEYGEDGKSWDNDECKIIFNSKENVLGT